MTLTKPCISSKELKCIGACWPEDRTIRLCLYSVAAEAERYSASDPTRSRLSVRPQENFEAKGTGSARSRCVSVTSTPLTETEQLCEQLARSPYKPSGADLFPRANDQSLPQASQCTPRHGIGACPLSRTRPRSRPVMYFEVPNTKFRLAGTIHSFPQPCPDVPKWLWQAYDWAEDLVVESSSDTFAPHRRLANGDRLSDYLPPDVFQQLSAIWDASEGPLEEMKPWAVFLALPSMIVRMVPGVEGQLINKAKRQKKPIYWIEKGADVAPKFDAVPVSYYIDQITSMLADQPKVRDGVQRIHTDWLSGELARTALELPVFATPVLHETFFAGRNRTWMPIIQRGIKARRRALFLVGALHLCGEQSLPELIALNGYKLAKVNVDTRRAKTQ